MIGEQRHAGGCDDTPGRRCNKAQIVVRRLSACRLENLIGAAEHAGGTGRIDDLAALEYQDADPLLDKLVFHSDILVAKGVWHNDIDASFSAKPDDALIAAPRMRKLVETKNREIVMSANFLNGIRVLDLSQFLPGPFAMQMLADMGADVVKVEPPKGDPMRYLDPVTNARGPSPYHALVNAGKRIVMLDLKSPEGQATFERLVMNADVLMESYRPGVLGKLGFGHQRLRDINPRLVHCALSGYGQNGPLRLAGGHDINYVAAAGQLGLSGGVDKPHMSYPMVADYAGAMQSVAAILGALVGRSRSGKGAYLDIALADSVLAWQSQALTAHAAGNVPARGNNLLTGGAAFYGVYETADHRFVSLGAIETVFWENFCHAIDRPDLIERQSDPLPQTALIATVAEIFRARILADWIDCLANVDCCCHPVLDIDEVTAHPQNAARGLVQPQQGLEDSKAVSVLCPFWTDGEPPGQRPAMREVDIDEVLSDWAASA